MKIGLIDVDGHNFPNLPLMKISAWHKRQGDSVEWYSPMFSGHLDRVYVSKVFSFTPDYQYHINATEVFRGGSGYAVDLQDGKEVFHPELDQSLPYEIEHIYPDYSLYPELCSDTAYGFMTRGCPRHCPFCIVGDKEGCVTRTVAPLDEFWHGQKQIKLLDPNITASADCENLFQQLIDSKAKIEFDQGLDARLLTPQKVEMLKKMKLFPLHMALDNYQDMEIVSEKLKMVNEITGWDRHQVMVYVLVNYNTTLEQDLERVYAIRKLGFAPFVMVYNKMNLHRADLCRQMQRWVNNPWIFMKTERFEDYENLTSQQRDYVKGLHV